MLQFNNKFDYLPLSRKDTPNGRFYAVDDVPVPSVTTILSKHKDMTTIDNWRKRIGTHNADLIVKTSSSIGSSMHNYLEDYVNGIDKPRGTNPFKIQAWKLAKIIIEKGLSTMEEFWGTEIGLNYETLYAGTTDLVGIYEGDEAIVDFKNTRRPKKEEFVADYKKQLASYGMAHNHKYGTNIRKGVILMVSREQENFGEFQKFVIEGNDWDNATNEWIATLDKFYE